MTCYEILTQCSLVNTKGHPTRQLHFLCTLSRLKAHMYTLKIQVIRMGYSILYHSKLCHQFLFSHHLIYWQCVGIAIGNEALIIQIPTCCTICSDRSLQSLQTEKEHEQNPRIKLNCYLGKRTKFSDKTRSIGVHYKGTETIQTFTPVLATCPFDKTTLEILIIKFSFKFSSKTGVIIFYLYMKESLFSDLIEFWSKSIIMPADMLFSGFGIFRTYVIFLSSRLIWSPYNILLVDFPKGLP